MISTVNGESSAISHFFSFLHEVFLHLLQCFSHHRRNLSNVSKDELEVENTACDLKEAFPPHLPAQVRRPRLYAVLFPSSQVPLKSCPSCLRSELPQAHHPQTHPSKLPLRLTSRDPVPATLSFFPILASSSIGSSKLGTSSVPS